MKKTLLLAFLVFMAAASNAVQLEKLDIALNVDSSGKASVTENYELSFETPFEESEFAKQAADNSSSVSAWKTDFEFFQLHFADLPGNKYENSAITFDRDSKTIILKYALAEPFARLVEQGQRADRFQVEDKQFLAFKNAGAIIIPENTTIRFVFPANTEIDSTRLPSKASIAGNVLELSGIQSNLVKIEYTVTKPIAPKGDIFERLSEIYVILIPVLLVAAVIALLKRGEIEAKIQNYLVEHSEIKGRSPEEELDLDI